jgi:hypothetical protein
MSRIVGDDPVTDRARSPTYKKQDLGLHFEIFVGDRDFA